MSKSDESRSEARSMSDLKHVAKVLRGLTGDYELEAQTVEAALSERQELIEALRTTKRNFDVASYDIDVLLARISGSAKQDESQSEIGGFAQKEKAGGGA